jgi:RNA polymerase sigma-70 factor (ECF subfamily)
MHFADQLDRARKGDEEALEDLFARWRPVLRLQADQLLGRELSARVDPSDVVQDVWTQAYASLDQFRGGSEGEWVNWLRRLVAGHAANLRRTHLAEGRSVKREAAGAAFPPDSSPGPETMAILNEQDARLAEAMDRLPEDMRAVVVGRVFRQESFERLAGSLGLSSGHARVLWTRALRRLRQVLSADT